MSVFSLVSVAFGRGAAVLKRSAKFGKPSYGPAGAALVLADGSLALERVEAASIRFPALEDVSVALHFALCDSKGFTDARRAPILAKLCTFTFVTTLVLWGNDIAVVPDAIGALTNLKALNLHSNKIATLPASIGRLTALEELILFENNLSALPDAIGELTNLHDLRLFNNNIKVLPESISDLTKITRIMLPDTLLSHKQPTTVQTWLDERGATWHVSI